MWLQHHSQVAHPCDAPTMMWHVLRDAPTMMWHVLREAPTLVWHVPEVTKGVVNR